MTRPKHERLIDMMTDAYWGIENKDRSQNDIERMLPVVGVITTLLRSQPRSDDCAGSLEWAAAWIDNRLQEDSK